MKEIYSIDCETHDPLLKDIGWSWLHNEGYILITDVFHNGEHKTVCGLKNENSPYTVEERKEQNEYLKSIITNENAIVIGANIMYDIGWFVYELNLTPFDVKCELVDVLVAERYIYEHNNNINLESLGLKYLNKGKTKDLAEAWVNGTHKETSWDCETNTYTTHEVPNVPNARGDFRKYLKECPYDLLEVYVQGDTELPYYIWKKQLHIIKQQVEDDKKGGKITLQSTALDMLKIDFTMLKIALLFSVRGMKFNKDIWKHEGERLKEAQAKYEQMFYLKYKKFNYKSTKQIAEFFDELGILYSDKWVLKGKNNIAFTSDEERDNGLKEVKSIIPQFRFIKKIPTAFIEHKDCAKIKEVLDDMGYMYTYNPHIDKNVLEGLGERYQVCADLYNLKNATNLITKFFGEKFERFVFEDKVHSIIRTNQAVTGRMASTSANLQNIPSRGGLDYDKEKDCFTYDYAKMCRTCFDAPKGMVYLHQDMASEEYRMFCNYAVGEGSEEVRAKYKENPYLDFHKVVQEMTGIKERKIVKRLNFGKLYGAGIESIATLLGCSVTEAKAFIEQYDDNIPFALTTAQYIAVVGTKRGYIRTLGGRHFHLRNKNLGYTLLNALCQGSSADVLKKALVMAWNSGLLARENDLFVCNTVYDEVNGYVAPTKEGAMCVRLLKHYMEHGFVTKVPLVTDPDFGTDWFNNIEYKDITEENKPSDEAYTLARKYIEIKDMPISDIISELGLKEI